MILQELVVQNFQSYYGPSNIIKFKEGLNLIIGFNAKGKSSLFNSFFWVLFGEIYFTGLGWHRTDELEFSTNGTIKNHMFINRKALYDLPLNSNLQAIVKLTLIDGEQQKFEIERQVNVRRINNGDYEAADTWDVSTNQFKVSYETNDGYKILRDLDASSKIDDLFPEAFRKYIWFQGEAIENLIDFQDKKTLKNAVKHISYYPYYEKLTDVISYSKSKIESEESKKINQKHKNNKHLLELSHKRDFLRSQIDREKVDQKNLEERKSILEICINEEELKLGSISDYNKLVTDFYKKKQEHSEFLSELERADEYERSKVQSLWILRGLTPFINEFKDLLNNFKVNQIESPDEKYLDTPGRSKLEEILRDQQCFVCGSNTSEGSEAFVWIKKRLEDQDNYLRELESYRSERDHNQKFIYFLGSLRDAPDILKVAIESIESQYRESEENIHNLKAKRNIAFNELRKIEEEIDIIRKNSGIDPLTETEKGGQILGTIKASRIELNTVVNKLNAINLKLGKLEQEYSQCDKDIADFTDKNGLEKVDETNWKLISTYLEAVCKNVQEKERIDLLKKIQEEANRIYFIFVSHDKQVASGKIEINNDYSIKIDPLLNTAHQVRIKISIISAIHFLNANALGVQYPYVNDAPTSMFDVNSSFSYLMGAKDIYQQSIIMTKDIDLKDASFNLIKNEKNISQIFILESVRSGSNDDFPQPHEVFTKINRLK